MNPRLTYLSLYALVGAGALFAVFISSKDDDKMVTSESIAESGAGSIVESGAGSFIGGGTGSFAESDSEEEDFEELSADEVLRQLDMASLDNLENEADEEADNSRNFRDSGRAVSSQVPILERMSEPEADAAAAELLIEPAHTEVDKDEHVEDEDSDSDSFGDEHEIQGSQVESLIERINPLVTEDAFEDAIESDDTHHIPDAIPEVHIVYSTETVMLQDSFDDAMDSSDTFVSSPHATPNVHVTSSPMTMNLVVTENEYAEAVEPETTFPNSPATSHNRLVGSTDDDGWDEPRQAQGIESSDEEALDIDPISTDLDQQESDALRESAATTSMIDDVENLVVDRLSSITQETDVTSVPDQDDDASRISAPVDRLSSITQEPHVMSLPDQEDEIHRISAAVGCLSDITQEPHVISSPKREDEIPPYSEPSYGTIEETPQRPPEMHQEIQHSPVNTPNPRQQLHKLHSLEQTEGIRLSEKNDFRENVVSDHDMGESAFTDTITVEDDDFIETKSSAVQGPSDEEQNATVMEAMEVYTNASPSTDVNNEVSLPVSVILDDSVFVAPPPAPISRPVVYGTLNPMNENDDSDDSDEENDNETMQGVPPPLDLPVSDDEDDELEVDQSVADAIRLESEKRKSKADVLNKVEGPSLVKAMASAVAYNSGNDEIVLAFETETRAPHTVGFDSSPVAVHTKESEDSDVFGIGYQNIKPRRQSIFGKQPTTSEYSLPKNSTFPDEKEFENECELTTDIQFSVKKERRATELSTAAISTDNEDGDNEDDEFGAAITAIPNVDISADLLASKRASFEARIASEQVALVQELKTETEQEHQQIVMEIHEGQHEIVGSSQKKEDVEQALSVKELHSMYKRGLGDQSVLMVDDAPKKAVSALLEGNPSDSEPPRLSVMGRILSKKSVMSQAITEEDGEDESDDNEGQGEDQNEVDEDQESTRADQEMLIDYTEAQNERESSGSVDEWQEIELLQAKKRTGASANKLESGTDTPAVDDSIMISYSEAAEYFSTAEEFLLQLDRIVVEDEGSPTKTSCFTCFARPRLAFAGANEERDRVFCVAATSYDPGNIIFVRTLQTIYCRFTSTEREVPLSGSHWESIGFQGNDPSTDLRGCGVLSLLQMLYLVENHTELARRFFRLAQHPLRHFPLACTLINVTLQCIVALRSGALFRECNKQNSIVNAINLFYVSLSSQLMDEIQSSTADIPIVMKRVLDNGRLNPDKVIELGYQPSPSVPSSSSPSKARSTKSAATASESNLEFTEIALHSTGD